jgi:hypothetical protein
VTAAVLLGLALVSQAKDVPDTSALAAHLGIELDDLDFEIRRQQGALQVAKARLATTQRAVQRGVASQSELEQVLADVHSLEARQAEATSFRALKSYERGVLNQAVPADEEKAFDLVLDVLRKQEAMAQVEVDFQAYRMKQNEALLLRGAITRPERDGAEIDYDTARLHVALSRARQAQVAFQRASRPAAKPPAAQERARLKTACFEARVRYYEIAATLAKNRLEMAKDQLKRALMTQTDLDYYQKSLEATDAALAAERKRLADPEAPLPTSLPRAG